MIDTKGRSLEFFYRDGHSDGMVTAELFDWTEHVFVTPRTRLTEALKREEAAIAKMVSFLASLRVRLPAIRVEIFIQRSRPAGSSRAVPAYGPPDAGTNTATTETARFFLHKPRIDLTAKAIFQEGEFVVEAASQARTDWHEKGPYKSLYEALVRPGVPPKTAGEHRAFTKDYAFRSPSAAAADMFGHAVSGAATWKLEDNPNITFRDWQPQQLAAIPNEGAAL